MKHPRSALDRSLLQLLGNEHQRAHPNTPPPRPARCSQEYSSKLMRPDYPIDENYGTQRICASSD